MKNITQKCIIYAESMKIKINIYIICILIVVLALVGVGTLRYYSEAKFVKYTNSVENTHIEFSNLLIEMSDIGNDFGEAYVAASGSKSANETSSIATIIKTKSQDVSNLIDKAEELQKQINEEGKSLTQNTLLLGNKQADFAKELHKDISLSEEEMKADLTELDSGIAWIHNFANSIEDWAIYNEVNALPQSSFNDPALASGLIKVDFGVSIDGCVADTSFSLDLENSEENKKLIKAAEIALKSATETISLGIAISNIGASIEKEIRSLGFQPIQNLSGHSIEQYNLHSGITIPNIDNGSPVQIIPGAYAIEPFVTNGLGSVRNGKLSGIYKLEKPGSVRDSFAREVLSFIVEEYQTLPFCSRWIFKKFSSRGLLALKQIEQSGVLYHYPQLIESGKGKVAQAEHTILITEKEKIITTL